MVLDDVLSGDRYATCIPAILPKQVYLVELDLVVLELAIVPILQGKLKAPTSILFIPSRDHGPAAYLLLVDIGAKG